MLYVWITFLVLCQCCGNVTAAPKNMRLPAIIGGSVAGGVVGLSAIGLIIYLLVRAHRFNQLNSESEQGPPPISSGAKVSILPINSPQSLYKSPISPTTPSAVSPISPASTFDPNAPKPRRPVRPPSLDFWTSHARPFSGSKSSRSIGTPPSLPDNAPSHNLSSSRPIVPTGPRPRPPPKPTHISSQSSHPPYSPPYSPQSPASPPSATSPQHQQTQPLLIIRSPRSPRRVKTMEHLPPRQSSLTNLSHSFPESPLTPGFGHSMGVRVPPTRPLPSARRSGASKIVMELDVPDDVGEDMYSPGPSSAFVVSRAQPAADPVLPRSAGGITSRDQSRYGGYPNRTAYPVGERPHHDFTGAYGAESGGGRRQSVRQMKPASRSLPQLRER